MELDENTIKKYITLDNEIHELELKSTCKNYKQYQGELTRAKEYQTKLQTEYDQSRKKTETEKKDVDDLAKEMEKMVMGKGGQASYDKMRSKEEAEYLEALAVQDISEKKLNKANEKIKELEQKMAPAKADAEALEKKCAEEDALLGSIFQGSYGSALENKLEADLEMYRGKQEKIGVAYYKWTNGRVLLQHATNQLAFAVKRWQDLMKIPQSQNQQLYQVATEVRNNVIAASQNLGSTQQYLCHITFPYCKPDEVETLEKACANIYTDMRTTERANHACQCYSTTHLRSTALLQWFDAVINKTIVNDRDTTTALAAEAEKHLRAERMRLIKELADKHNIKFDMDNSGFKKDDPQQIQQPDVKPAGDLQKIDSTPETAPQRNIAAEPTQEEIFGNMEELKKHHEERINEYQKVEEMNKARVDQGLQARLAERLERRKKRAS